MSGFVRNSFNHTPYIEVQGIFIWVLGNQTSLDQNISIFSNNQFWITLVIFCICFRHSILGLWLWYMCKAIRMAIVISPNDTALWVIKVEFCPDFGVKPGMFSYILILLVMGRVWEVCMVIKWNYKQFFSPLTQIL